MKKPLFTSFLGALFSAGCLAASNCDKPVNDFDGLYCLNKVYNEADRELNEKYGQLAGQLDAEGKAKLKRGQIAWMRNRNSQCSRHEGHEFFVNLECATRETISRAEFLQSRLRECSSTGCQSSRL
ncbi:lysozyme inhibitor LprI family protein [Azohydromonas caseinilytica]|uniref:DUF1311 domain-containing protein n=1 Tax=Azohydromonas caseinilytica TaxID=2728836 RepID=A0A848FBM3_9BURK|nr:lysozyme inhibitor LprI family protein [Azohydromonas caseinilytica]NML16135.1 DUF1311 domain-containing protein [Azohydromonas caseinilytica]